MTELGTKPVTNLAIIFGIIMLAVSAVSNAAETRVNPHLKDEAGKGGLCSECHKPHGGSGGGVSPLLIEESESLLCARCHQETNDHPVDIAPKRAKVPKELPLDKDGKIVCSTCHDSHNTSQYPKMLRLNANALCSKCHER